MMNLIYGYANKDEGGIQKILLVYHPKWSKLDNIRIGCEEGKGIHMSDPKE